MKKSSAIKLITVKCREMQITKVEQIQYIIATVEHETAGTFRPVEEAYFVKNPKEYRKKLKYAPYWGRGFSQITHKKNYQKFSKIMDIDLVNNPDLALEFDNSLFILIHGMKHGTFTGKSLDDYMNDEGTNFIKARKIINGRDRAEKIAKMAQRIKIKR